MTLIPHIDTVITRLPMGIIGVSKVRRNLRAIIMFFLPLSIDLSESFCPGIIDDTILDKTIILDSDSDNSFFFLM